MGAKELADRLRRASVFLLFKGESGAINLTAWREEGKDYT